MDGQQEMTVDARAEEIYELCSLARVSRSYADFQIRAGASATQVRHDLFEGLGKDPEHPLRAGMKEQVKRGL